MWRQTECSNCQDEAWTNGSKIEDVLCDKCFELVSLRDKVERYEKALRSIYEIVGYEDDEKMVDVLLQTVEKALKG